LNKLGDNDEEWVVEMAIPLHALGVGRGAAGTRIAFSVQRCEMGHGGRQSWGGASAGELVPDP
jgi:hypothetical protein